jgi:hypothetical protein
MPGGNTNSLKPIPPPNDAEIFMQSVMKVRTQTSVDGNREPRRAFTTWVAGSVDKIAV